MKWEPLLHIVWSAEEETPFLLVLGVTDLWMDGISSPCPNLRPEHDDEAEFAGVFYKMEWNRVIFIEMK